ncbi:MAG: hypothetical protein M1814_000628, partial [Vezdaea aestivalis]
MPRGLFFLFHVSLVIFNTHLIPAEPDVLPPEFWSNIDPAKADPRRNISCQGPLPRWIFPRVEGWDPNLEADVLSLCAAPQYGGAGKRSIDLPEPSYDPRRGAGFYCYGPIDSPSIGLPDLAVQATIFKLDNQARVLSLPELALFCRQRCFCNNFPRPMALRPKGVPDSQDVVQHFVAPEDARLVRQISIQETNFASIERRTKRTESPSIMTLITKIYKSYNRYQENEQGEMHSVPSTKLQIIDIWPKNKIVCIPGQVPSLPFPRPYNKEDFSSIMELCAVSLAGGHPDANAGAYCDPGGWYDVEPDIWFSDEYTPRFEWTWSSNWRFAALVRTFCWSKCRCKYAPMVRNRPADALFRATDVTAFKSLRYENVEMMVQRGDVPSQPFPNPNAPFTCSTGCIVSTLD